MLTLEDEIDSYTQNDFNAEAAAQIFFASHAENEITKRLNDMAALQGSIEVVLKKKVQQHYEVFLHANEEIANVGKEMTDLKILIENTQKLILDVKNNRNCVKTIGGPLLSISNRKESIASVCEVEQSVSEGLIPAWVIRSPEELAKCTIEHQYEPAVACVLRFRDYVESVKGLVEAGRGSRLGDIAGQVESRAGHLARTLRLSLTRLPASLLWGAGEQQGRLRLLLQLGQAVQAVQTFADCQVDVLSRVVRGCDMAGDTTRYVADLSRAFFATLEEKCRIFLKVFASHMSESVIVTQLLGWTHAQTAAFVSVLSRQVQLGVAEHSTLAIITLRSVCSSPKGRAASGQGSFAEDSTSLVSVALSDVIIAPISAEEVGNRDKTRAAMAATGGSVQPCETQRGHVSSGPLSFACSCVQHAYAESGRLQRLSVAGLSNLSLLLPAEIQGFIGSYADELVAELSSQVRQDSWAGVTPLYAVLLRPVGVPGPACYGGGNAVAQQQGLAAQLQPYCSNISSRGGGGGGAGVGSAQLSTLTSTLLLGQVGVGLSFDWLTCALNHFLDELSVLLTIKQQGSVGEGAYRREDMCEAEPVAVACLLRLVLRFIVELQAVDHAALSAAQLSCFRVTVELFHLAFLPSIQTVLIQANYFFCEGNVLLRHSPHFLIGSVEMRTQELLQTLNVKSSD